MQEKNIGHVVQIIGPVLDIRFQNGHLPNLLNAIEIEREDGKLVCEVAQQLGDDVVRCIAMSSTDGMVRGMEAVDTGTGIKVPVGKETLGRVFNLLGKAIDNLGDFFAKLSLDILDSVFGILHDIMEQSRTNRGRAKSDFLAHNLRDSDRVDDVRLTRAPPHAAVCALGKAEGALDYFHLLSVVAI